MRAALDSNILIYAEELSSDRRHMATQDLLLKTPSERIVIPVQALGETLRWLIRKAKVPNQLAADRMKEWSDQFDVQPTTLPILASACELLTHHDLQVWDAVILASAAEAGADLLLSEDMQDGFRWRGVTIVNPFLPSPNPLIESLIAK